MNKLFFFAGDYEDVDLDYFVCAPKLEDAIEGYKQYLVRQEQVDGEDYEWRYIFNDCLTIWELPTSSLETGVLEWYSDLIPIPGSEYGQE